MKSLEKLRTPALIAALAEFESMEQWDHCIIVRDELSRRGHVFPKADDV